MDTTFHNTRHRSAAAIARKPVASAPAAAKPAFAPRRRPILAELAFSDTCTAAGVTATGSAPALTLCRQLLAAGLDPDQALDVYRGTTLALRIRSIGQAAGLEINSHGTAFIALRERRTASPMRSSDDLGPEYREAAE